MSSLIIVTLYNTLLTCAMHSMSYPGFKFQSSATTWVFFKKCFKETFTLSLKNFRSFPYFRKLLFEIQDLVRFLVFKWFLTFNMFVFVLWSTKALIELSALQNEFMDYFLTFLNNWNWMFLLFKIIDDEKTEHYKHFWSCEKIILYFSNNFMSILLGVLINRFGRQFFRALLIWNSCPGNFLSQQLYIREFFQHNPELRYQNEAIASKFSWRDMGPL